MADNNNKGGGGQQKAANGLTMSVGIDPADMNENKLANVAGIAGVTVLAALALRWGMPLLRKFGFGISDEAARRAAEAITPDKAVGVVLNSLQGKDNTPPLNPGNIRFIQKCIGPALAAANKVSQQPEKDKADSLNAMNKAIADFTAITSGTEVSNG